MKGLYGQILKVDLGRQQFKVDSVNDEIYHK